jgi:predicted metalloprotease with PDZ domain
MKYFKIPFLLIAISLIFSCKNSKTVTENSTEEEVIVKEHIKFNVNLNDRSKDTYKVRVTVPKLSEENNIFQFAATAPGTYQIMDMGRFVRSFIAMDKKGNILKTTNISTNQYQLLQPKKVHTIIYEIAETFDNPVTENPIYVMAGTSIEEDHALINGQAVFGYIKGMQSMQMNIKIEHPEEWMAGTALELNEDGSYTANNFDHAVDSPILLGNLTKASTNVEGTEVDIYTYSAKGMIQSQQVLASMEGMLKSASKFLNGLPVDRYTFLLHFENNNIQPKGAWEHSYSSEYTLNERPWEQAEKGFKDIAAHEFFHIVTPLNIHSEIIEKFNFIKPVPSRHLWLYEGTTEWASHMMLFRSGEKTFEDYLGTLRRKSYMSKNYFDVDYSLLDLSLESFTEAGHKQYANIYMKGALVAGLLDIRLLELSNGERGLIDVVNELAKKYGPAKSFVDATFFKEFVDFTYPEIEEFMELYVKKATDLPYNEFYNKIGVKYDAEKYLFELDPNATEDQIKLREHWMKAL